MTKFKIAIGILVLTSTVAFSQQSNNSATQPSEYVLRIKPNDVNVIGKALGKLPFDEVADLVQSLRMQMIEQQQKVVAPKPVEETEKK